jgi:hypothetical protein
MRAPVVFLTTVFTVLVTSTRLWAQNGDRTGGEEEFVPYHTHRDSRFGHAHSYPDRGAIIRDVPKTAMVVSYAGISYRFNDGVWFEPRGPAFMVTAPPIGLIVSSLPPFSTVLARGGRTFLYSNDTFYMPRPDVGGYEVVNDPDDGGANGMASPPAPPPPSPSWDGSSLKAMDAPTAATTTALAANAVSASAAAPVVAAPAVVAATPTASSATLAAATAAPIAVSNASAADAEQSSKALIYPKNGQSADQQARDRYECYRFGVAQSGFDPMHPVAGSGATSRAGGAADFERAQGVCLDAHGYPVR